MVTNEYDFYNSFYNGKKVLDSAIANAEHNMGADIDDLRVAQVFADQGPTYKRMHAKAKE